MSTEKGEPPAKNVKELSESETIYLCYFFDYLRAYCDSVVHLIDECECKIETRHARFSDEWSKI